MFINTDDAPLIRVKLAVLKKKIMMMMVWYGCGKVDRRKALSPIFNWDHCQRSSPSRISDTPQAGFEHAQNMS